MLCLRLIDGTSQISLQTRAYLKYIEIKGHLGMSIPFPKASVQVSGHHITVTLFNGGILITRCEPPFFLDPMLYRGERIHLGAGRLVQAFSLPNNGPVVLASLESEQSPGRLGEAAVVGSWNRGLRPGRGGSRWWVFLGRGCEVMSLESRACVLWEPPDLPLFRGFFFFYS